MVFVLGEAIGQLKCLWLQGRDSRQFSSIREFNNASRSPLGSLTIICRHRGRTLASLRAAIIVVVFLFDPFIQQILSYPTREAASPTNSGTAVASWITSIPSPYLSEFTLALEGMMVLLFNLLAHPEVHLVYLQSLEVCSRCINVAESATLNCTMASSSDNTTTGHAKSLFRKATHWRQPLTISQNSSTRRVTFSYTERIIWEGLTYSNSGTRDYQRPKWISQMRRCQ
jgi:hypothetical protein